MNERFRLSRLAATIACAALLNLLAAAQLQQSRPCTLRILLAYDGDTGGTKDVTVELMDAVGGSSTMNRKQVMELDRVEFATLTGTHRVRIYGSGIEEYSGQIEIAPAEAFHVERIRLRVKPAEANLPATAGPKPTVPAVRLKIPAKAEKEFDKGSKLLREERWVESKTHFQAAIAEYADYDMAYNGLGVASSALNQDTEAQAAFERAVQLNPKFAEAQRNLARLLLKQKQYSVALTILDQSIEIEPTNVWAITNAALSELQLHHFERAVERTRQADKLPHAGTSGADIHLIWAYALEGLGKQSEAVVQYKQYLTEDPKGPNSNRAERAIARLSASK
jgi:tetratricopeptide (TPR) repeat protein